MRDISQRDHKVHWVKTLSFKNVRRKHLRPLIFLMNQQTFSSRGLHRKNGHRWSVSLDLTKSHEGIFKQKMLYNCCRCHVYMYLFHQRHYSWLTFAVSYQRNILKDVTNRNGIKAATIKFFLSIPAVLNYPRKT